MNIFSRSWEITKASFKVIKEEKQILTFPILSGIFSLLFIILMLALLIPGVIFGFLFGLNAGNLNAGVHAIVAVWMFFVALSYLGIYFIATFFNVCTVHTAAVCFSNKDAKFANTIKFAFSRIHVIFLWSLVAATVGILLHILEALARNAKGLGSILLQVTEWIFGLAWSIATIFVIPVMVYENTGPFASIKTSVLTLKKTWGESIIRAVGLGTAESIFIFLGIVVFVPLILLSLGIGYLLLALILLFIIYILFVVLLFGTANAVFNTALYVYAKTGKAPGNFDKESLKSGFKQRKSLFTTLNSKL